jgi:5-formyltetrahydrofolate cyclo-ligase
MKSKIREEMKMKRKAMPKEVVLAKSLMAQSVFLDSDIYREAETLMLYIPLGNETSTLDIIEKAYDDGKTVLVPVTDSKTYELTAHEITRDTEFEKGMFSVTEPREKVPFDTSRIDVVLVPGIAFSRDGSRIGFGKGCYDKFLKDTEVLKVGFCYDFQITDEVYADSFDIEMDYLITEKEFIDCKNGV